MSALANINLTFDYKIAHRNWKMALSETFSLVSLASPGDVICLTGPSRGGKSRLATEVKFMLSNGHDSDATGILPVVYLRAVNQGTNGAFSTKEFSQRLLSAVRHPIFNDNFIGGKKRGLIDAYDSTSEAAYMRAFSQAIAQRKIRYLFIDEAQHVVYVSKDAMAPVAVMDSWKSFAEENNLVLVIIGAYPVLQIISRSTHMVGRIQRVHLPRYLENEADLEEFRNIILAYQDKMTIDPRLGCLDDHLETLYRGSLGCIGLLRKWLKTASIFAHAAGENVSMDSLVRAAPSAYELNLVRKEIQEGESFLKCFYNAQASEIVTTAYSFSDSPEPKRKSKRKPFQRNPKRIAANNRGSLGGINDE